MLNEEQVKETADIYLQVMESESGKSIFVKFKEQDNEN